MDDPLSSVLLDLRLSGTFFCHSELAAPWSLSIPERDFASFHFAASRQCWLQLLGAKSRAPIALEPGDLALVPRSPRQVFASTPRRTGTALASLPARELATGVSAVHVGGRGQMSLVICGGVRIGGFAASMLVDLLPDVVVLRAASAGPVVAHALEAMKQESRIARPGSATLMTRLADVIVIQAIRSWIESAAPTGWLAGLRDPQIGRAMAEIHQHPDRAWSVAALARTAGLSRSRFSERFTALAGFAPMLYVTKVQMHRAAEMIQHERLTVAELATRFGYDSEPAFARAFKRHVGMPPGAVRRAGVA
ncbi:MAG: AraC family transcriptional regulator [Kofleriaceae bacterium]